MTGGDRYEAVDQVRLYVIPNTMEWGVCQKDFWGLFSDGAEVLYFGACNSQRSRGRMRSDRRMWLLIVNSGRVEKGEIWEAGGAGLCPN